MTPAAKPVLLTDETAVLLVHGTWGRSSPLIRDDSKMIAMLKAEFGEGAVYCFSWSGKNRMDARLTAAEDLRAFILSRDNENVRVQRPELCIVAHSHGGFLVLKALEDPEVAARVSHVAFLATPFLHFEISPPHLLLARLLTFLTSLVTMMLLAWKLADFLGGSPWIGVIGALGGVIGVFANRPLLEGGEAEVCQRLNLKPIVGPRMMILRNPADEVGALFAATSVLRSLFAALGSLPVRISPVVLMGLYLIGLLVFLVNRGFEDVDFIQAVIFSVVLLAVFGSLDLMDKATRMVFGHDVPRLTRGLAVHSDIVPFSGQFQVLLASDLQKNLDLMDQANVAAGNKLFRRSPLAHVSLYDDPIVLNGVRDFLAGASKEDSPKSSV